MEYSSLLSSYISNSRLTLQEIEDRMKQKGFSTNKAYISKLQNGKLPPAGEDITRALAEVTGGDIDALLLAGYIEKAPDEIKSILTEASNTGELFAFFASLVVYLEEYRSTGNVNKELLGDINTMNNAFANDYKYRLATGSLEDFPEYTAELIARLKQHFIPLTDSIAFRGGKIDFSDYVTKEGKPIFRNNPYPEIIKDTEKVVLEEIKEQQEANRRRYEEADRRQREETIDNGGFRTLYDIKKGLTQQKIDFFESLEDELGLDLTDPAVQKKLKRAAKIIFSDED